MYPCCLWMFVMGMSMIISIQANNLARDMDNMYIHGTDFSTYGAQQLAQLVATGLDLEFPAFGATSGVTNLNQAKNVGSSGNGLIWVTQVMYVGATTDPLCQVVGASNCANHDSFVYTQQIEFGNSTSDFAKGHERRLLHRIGSSRHAGVISEPRNRQFREARQHIPNGDGRPVANHSNGQASLVDGQTIYVVEAFFQTPTLNMGSIYKSPGTYARYFF